MFKKYYICKLISKLFMKKKTKNMAIKDKRYMLFLFGDFSDDENLVNEINYQLIAIVSSKFIKFNYGEFGMVCHFRTKETFNDLKEYIDMSLNEITEQYYLVEVGTNFDVKMDRPLKKDFLNIDDEKPQNKNGSIEIGEPTEIKFKPTKKEMDIYHMMFPIMDPNFFKTNEDEIVKDPSIDDILDKITETGIESLTEREKQILENYGKK
jgi:hypothetical protein